MANQLNQTDYDVILLARQIRVEGGTLPTPTNPFPQAGSSVGEGQIYPNGLLSNE